jgi:hypothetical protein
VSEVSDAAIVRLFLADYAATDPAGKVNVIGGGVTGVGMNPATRTTTPFTLFASVAVPPPLYNAECAVEIILQDSAENLVSVPGPAPGMPAQPLRVGQAVRFEEPRFPQPVSSPARFLYARTQWVLGFATGLPLTPGEGYTWRVNIDDNTRDDWTERFVVMGQPPGPVIG